MRCVLGAAIRPTSRGNPNDIRSRRRRSFAPENTLSGPLFVQASTKTAIKGFKVFDGNSALLTTTLTVEHGTLAIGSPGSAAVSGNGTGAVRLTGTIDDINAALTATDNLTYRGDTGIIGVDKLTMTTTDNGHAGIGPQSDTDQVAINVGTWLTGTAGHDTFESLSGFARIDARGGNDTITFDFKLVDATVTYDNNTVIIDGPSSHTVLTGFEKFVFTDGTVDNADGSPLVDDLFYYARNHDVWTAHVDAEQHYAQFGWHEGRDPNAFFSTSSYLSQLHGCGRRRSRSAHPLRGSSAGRRGGCRRTASIRAVSCRLSGRRGRACRSVAALSPVRHSRRPLCLSPGDPVTHRFDLAFGIEEGRHAHADGRPGIVRRPQRALTR